MEQDKEQVNKRDLSFWWSRSLSSIISMLAVNINGGLDTKQVKFYRDQYGPNSITSIAPTSILDLLIEGIKEPMMILLLSIAGLSLFFGQLKEAIAMIFVVASYIAIECINKYRADSTMAQLKALTEPETRVIRNGSITTIKTEDVVIGDIVILTEGMIVPADLRLIEALGLQVNEASLTGESLPIHKDAHAQVDKNAPLLERPNCLFSGTTIMTGVGKGIVMAVGSSSELGKIAHEVQAADKTETAIQRAMTHLAKTLAILAIIISLLIPAIGFARGLPWHEMVLTWLALTFLMIPGQPPIIITMALALASFELAAKKLIVRRLRGVEVLGQVSAIVTDKTGTITENSMTVQSFVLANGNLTTPANISADLNRLISLSLPKYSNDPTDQAIELAVGKSPEEPVSMEGFHEGHPWRMIAYEPNLCAYAGEPEQIINASTSTSEQKRKLLEILHQKTQAGSRVVAFAYGYNIRQESNLEGITFIALAVLSDPVRPGVKDAVTTLKQAGITTYIATGDHQTTTESVAHAIGIESPLCTGKQIENMSDTTLGQTIKTTHLFARISPTEKQRLVHALQNDKETVAVIGDGVNDAPAIKTANVGIAMGQIGTDLAKDAADLILTDDNYIHLPDAIMIGRKALDNFRKGLTYYLSAKAILLIIFLVSLAIGIPFPFAPIQIIMIELLMDLASSTIFVSEQAEPDITTRKPQNITRFLNKAIGLRIIRNGLPLACGILGVYLWLYYCTSTIIIAQTAAFVTWLIGHIMLALNLKQDKVPLTRQGLFKNFLGFSWLISMIILSLIITNVQCVAQYTHTCHLDTWTWVVVLLTAFCSTWWLEILKIINFEKKGLNKKTQLINFLKLF